MVRPGEPSGQPRSPVVEVPSGDGRGGTDDAGGLLERQAAEDPQLDHAGRVRVDGCEGGHGLLDDEHVDPQQRLVRRHVDEMLAAPVAAATKARVLAKSVHERVPHGPTEDREEVAPIAGVDGVAGEQFRAGFVGKRGAVESAGQPGAGVRAGQASQPRSGPPAQLVVDQFEEGVAGGEIADPRPIEESGDGAGRIRVLVPGHAAEPTRAGRRGQRPVTIVAVPTYRYAIIRPDGEDGECFEVVQKMSDPPLTVHPQSGAPVRRVPTAPNLSLRYGEAATKNALSDRNLERLGFAKYKNAGDGRFERLAGKGPDAISAD